MDWAGAIDRNLDDLLAVVARLFVLAGIRTGRSVIMMPRYLRIRVLAMLRPAEFAARRLIAIAACKLVTVTARRAGKPGRWASKAEDDLQEAASRPTTKTAPIGSLSSFPLFDPIKPYRHPWLENGEIDDDAKLPRDNGLRPDDPVDARTLCRRIIRLEQALQDLETHAKRLARWRARRDRLWSSSEDRPHLRPRRFSPIRPGRPPGWRKRPKTPVAEVLKECDALARDAWNTS